jgi:hypothetical protein
MTGSDATQWLLDLPRRMREELDRMADDPETPPPVKTMTTQEAAAFILTMPRERLDAALDAIRAEFAESEKEKEVK